MNKHGPTVEVKEFARRLIEIEKAAKDFHEHSDSYVPVAHSVCEKLRRPISTLAGDAGFRALLLRALSVARLEAKALSAVQIKPNGTLDGLERISPESAPEATFALIAQLLGLLITFLGESLTLQLVKERWPDMPESAFEGSLNT